jgi:prolyl-tRNA editing enzyme YbaK/EbsC (Cys-tRNA(Pro) deacylase)
MACAVRKPFWQHIAEFFSKRKPVWLQEDWKMSIEKVKEFFRQRGIEERVLEFDSSSATVELAARALNCEEKRIAKTLSFYVGDKAVLIVTAGDARIDNKKFKAHFQTKAKLLSPEDTEALVGHAVGGVCPFAINDGVEVYLDQSLQRFDTVFPACGSSNSAIELTIPELEQYSNYRAWVDVCKII